MFKLAQIIIAYRLPVDLTLGGYGGTDGGEDKLQDIEHFVDEGCQVLRDVLISLKAIVIDTEV